MGWGVSLLILGLFEKMMLADTLLGPRWRTPCIAITTAPARLDAWVGTLAFAGQIFFDFAGYSTCAIRVAHCFGFVLKPNFHFPYAALGFADFWRCWHISLSTWLRDYLYLPLGGSRRGTLRTYVNLMITMLLGGLWHGAAWRFVVWGPCTGCFWWWSGALGLEEALERSPAVVRAVGMLLTFALVCLAWVFFRPPSLAIAVELTTRMLTGAGPPASAGVVSTLNAATVFGVTAALLGVSCGVPGETRLEDLACGCRAGGCACCWRVCWRAWSWARGEDRVFIYFQF